MVRKLAVAGTGAYVVCLKNYQHRAFCSAENPSRSIDTVPKLYQYKICPFCNRVKSYMDYLNVAYEPVEVNPLTKKEISFSAEYKKVPIAEFEGCMLNGSDAIIDYLSSNYLSVEESERLITEDTQVRKSDNCFAHCMSSFVCKPSQHATNARNLIFIADSLTVFLYCLN